MFVRETIVFVQMTPRSVRFIDQSKKLERSLKDPAVQHGFTSMTAGRGLHRPWLSAGVVRRTDVRVRTSDMDERH